MADRRPQKYLFLFSSLVTLGVLYPYLENGIIPQAILNGVLSAVLVASAYAISKTRRILWLASTLGGLALVASWALVFSGSFSGISDRTDLLAIGGTSIRLLFFGVVALLLLKDIMSAGNVDSDRLYGAAALYLLLGITWYEAYVLVETLWPGSFVVTITEAGTALTRYELLYFSFITLTSVGYGDILPISSQARSLAFLEATIGTLYVAILIARLASSYYSPSSSGAAPSNPD